MNHRILDSKTLYHFKKLGFKTNYNQIFMGRFDEYFFNNYNIIRNIFFENSKIIILTNRDIFSNKIYGEDYYIYNFYTNLKQLGYNVKVLTINGKVSRKLTIYLCNFFDYIILHNISPVNVYFKYKTNNKCIIIFFVYFTWNKTLPTYRNLINVIGLLASRFFVDIIVVTSERLFRQLRCIGNRKVLVLPPNYHCSFCILEKNIRKYNELLDNLPPIVKVTYIGSLKEKRFPIMKIVKFFLKDKSRKYIMNIYTASGIKGDSYSMKKGNIEINISKKVLSEKEKCKVLSESHVFVAPSPKTTMDPPMSVLEALYHGNIIIYV